MYAVWRVCVFSVSLHCGEEKRRAKGGNDFLLFGRFHRFRPRELHRQPSAPTSDDKTPAKPQEKWGETKIKFTGTTPIKCHRSIRLLFFTKPTSQKGCVDFK
jgi:hypothetical protein